MTQSSDKQKLNFYHYLSNKLRRSTRISSSEKSCNNICEKYDTFSRVDIANQLLTRHTPFAPLGQVDEWKAKPSPFSILGRLWGYFRIMAAKNLKYSYRRWKRG